MQRLWLVFCQAVTLCLAVLFVVSTLRPEWLTRLSPTPAAPAAQIAAAPASVVPAPAAHPSGYSDAARRALPAVVHIFTSKEVRVPQHPFMNDPVFRHFFGDRLGQAQRRSAGLGSGVLVSPEGYILTNNHVIESADEIEVALNDGTKLNARTVGQDPETDLAVLKVDAPHALPAIQFSDPSALDVGAVVLAIGNPFGVGQTVTMGIVSALGRNHLGINTFESYIQTDAAINPGNSGGALVNDRGELVGINSAIYSRSGGSLGIGFAIPVSIARKVMEEIVRSGTVTRGWVGVGVQEMNAEMVSSFGLPRQGALISDVVATGPADRAGVQPGDVVTRVNDQPIADAQAFLEQIASQNPGSLIELALVRKGRELKATVQIGRRPPPQQQATAP